ncbi:MAG: SRPBCC family protein [Acidimicrobiia bacterium]
MPTPFRFDRAWLFAVAPEQLWTTFEQTDRYQGWWPWLKELTTQPGGLRAGNEARVVIQAPLPYQLRCVVRVDEAEPNRLLIATITGDLEGPARLELSPAQSGTEARLAWALEVRSSLLRPLASVARPALSWAHDRIVERGLVQFEQHALDEVS